MKRLYTTAVFDEGEYLRSRIQFMNSFRASDNMEPDDLIDHAESVAEVAREYADTLDEWVRRERARLALPSIKAEIASAERAVLEAAANWRHPGGWPVAMGERLAEAVDRLAEAKAKLEALET